MTKVLLHVCCGPCSLGCFDRLEGKDVILYFSNSNIFPAEEWEKRLVELKKVGKIHDFEVVVDSYEHKEWLDCVKGLETEPERGARCLKCFEFGLSRAAKKAKELGCDYFTTTLSVSRYKVSKDLFDIGLRVAAEEGVNFLEENFKKKGGYEKSVKLSKEMGLYRQDYCGCEFSLRK